MYVTYMLIKVAGQQWLYAYSTSRRNWREALLTPVAWRGLREPLTFLGAERGGGLARTALGGAISRRRGHLARVLAASFGVVARQRHRRQRFIGGERCLRHGARPRIEGMAPSLSP